MRQTVMVAVVAAAVTAIVSIWGTSAIIAAQSPKGAVAAKIAGAGDVMQMMMEAKALPEERFDAH